MSRLLISTRHLFAAERHAVSTYPSECCGVLVGRELEPSPREPGGGALVEQILPVRNQRTADSARRFTMDPEAVLAAHKQARSRGLEVVGYYHSHPDHPAAPSDLDVRNAWPEVSYLILGLEKGRLVEATSWRLAADGKTLEPERIDNVGTPFEERGRRARAV